MKPSRSVLLFGLVGGVCLLLVAVQPTARTDYIGQLPPDTVGYRPAKLDSIGLALAKCFGKPRGMVAELRWYMTDSLLGPSDAAGWRQQAGGRYFARWKAVVMRRPYQDVPFMVDHEIRHHLADRAGQHPASVFERAC